MTDSLPQAREVCTIYILQPTIWSPPPPHIIPRRHTVCGRPLTQTVLRLYWNEQIIKTDVLQ